MVGLVLLFEVACKARRRRKRRRNLGEDGIIIVLKSLVDVGYYGAGCGLLGMRREKGARGCNVGVMMMA